MLLNWELFEKWDCVYFKKKYGPQTCHDPGSLEMKWGRGSRNEEK